MNKKFIKIRRTNYLLIFISGILTPIPLLFDEAAYLILISLVPFLIFIYYQKSLVRLWLGSFLFYFFASIIICSFSVVEPINLLLSSFIFSFFGIFVWFFKEFLPNRNKNKQKIFSRDVRVFLKNFLSLFRSKDEYQEDKPFYFWIMLPILFVFFQYLLMILNYIPTTSGALGNALAFSVFFPLAKIAGLWGLTLFVLIINVLILRIIIDRRYRKRWIFFLIITLIFFLVLSYFFYSQANNKERNNKINFAAVSFSAEFIESSPEYKDLGSRLEDADFQDVTDFLSQMSRELTEIIPEEAEYVFLPTNIWGSTREGETYGVAFSEYGITNNGAVIIFLRQLAKKLNKNIITGMVTLENDKKYNSVLFFDNEGNLADIYHKTNLMLSSEYWPFGNWVPFWMYWINGNKNLYINPGFSRSDTPFSNFKTKHDLNIGPLICSETMVPGNFGRVKKNGANIIFASVNNNWRIALDLGFFQEMSFKVLRINSFYYDIPVILTGKENYTGIILPNGDYDIVKPEKGKKFNVWAGSLNY